MVIYLLLFKIFCDSILFLFCVVCILYFVYYIVLLVFVFIVLIEKYYRYDEVIVGCSECCSVVGGFGVGR